jgi:predicted transcriptional regulator
MDALDAELDEIVAAGSAQQQADKADELLKDEPKLNVSDKKYMDAITACHKLSIGRWSKPDTKEISARIGAPVKITGKILKELVANGYMLVEKQGRSNVFTLTPDGEKLLPPPEELDSRVPKVVKNLISSEKDYESYVDALNYLYSAVDKTDLGNVSWVFGNGWQWAYVNPAKRKYYLLAISEKGLLASVSFSSPDSTNTQSEKGNIIWHWPADESYYSYIDERVADITKAYAKIKDFESKIYSYSFYSSKQNKNVKNKEEMLAVVEGTEGTGMKYYYRYGFAYRGATRREVSYEKFREYCNHAQVDIDVNYNTMEAEVNEFSENDMY